MAGREVREYTNLTDPKDKKWGKGKDKIDDEDVTFQRMVAKMQEVAGERGGYLHGRGALDSDDLLYLKEQMEAEEDAERLLRRTEKRAFAAFKKAASLADSSPVSAPLTLRVEPKQKSGIRQQDLLKKVVEIKPKKQKVASPSNGNQLSLPQKNVGATSTNLKPESDLVKDKAHLSSPSIKTDGESKVETTSQSLLGLAYASSDDED
ncbi:hypothetical protein ACLB2K_045362 [Fragaria x ananassa]